MNPTGLAMAFADVLAQNCFRSLDDHETVQPGDFIRDAEIGQLNVVSEDTYHGVAIGIPAGEVRTWKNIRDVVRTASATTDKGSEGWPMT